MRATTIRALGRHLWLIDEEFRQNPRNHRLFHEILRAPVGVTHELRRLNLYGVLGRYIPAFGRIVGRMQYDLFHAYTVDAHTLFVVRNLRRLALPRFEHEFPELSRLMATLPKPELAYLAALFHDIAKGRGGDHSELGAVDAEAFCLEQGLSRYDARLVAWLVRHHLLFSVTAQKKDISDPQVIREFARIVGDQTHLDYLYLLTVADVRGTNPKLWNSWKSALFSDFYERTKRALRRGLEAPLDQEELVAEVRAAARDELCPAGARRRAGRRGLDAASTTRTSCATRPPRSPGTPAARASATPANPSTLVAVRHTPERGGNAVLTFLPHRQQNFARTTALLDQMGLNILDARITPLEGGMSLDTYLVLEDNGAPIADRHRAQEIEQQLWRVLQAPEAALPVVTRRAPRQVRMFTTPTQITFTDDPVQNRTILELIAGDRPGLLSEIGKVFLAERIDVATAKIMTIGERAEDVFFVTDHQGRALSETGAAQAPGSAVRGARPPGRGQARLSVAAAPMERYPASHPPSTRRSRHARNSRPERAPPEVRAAVDRVARPARHRAAARRGEARRAVARHMNG